MFVSAYHLMGLEACMIVGFACKLKTQPRASYFKKTNNNKIKTKQRIARYQLQSFTANVSRTWNPVTFRKQTLLLTANEARTPTKLLQVQVYLPYYSPAGSEFHYKNFLYFRAV